MSTMTKLLRQSCLFEAAQRSSDGRTILNEYGDIQYESGESLKCRREKHVRDMQTANGAIIQTSSRYFLDNFREIQTDDRLDGHVIVACEEYTDQMGVCIGYEVYV